MPCRTDRRLIFIPPMLPTLVAEPPSGDAWLHEIKYDGYRTQVVIDHDGVRAFSRNGHDWTERYLPIVNEAARLECSSAIIDGEMIVQDEQGRSDFDAFKAALGRRPEALVFMAFDLVHLNGRDLRAQALVDRRAALQELAGCNVSHCPIQFSDHVVGSGADLFEVADRMGLEGIVSKLAASRYRSGRTRDWLKVKCWTEGEFVVVGVEIGREGPPVALLARSGPEGLSYAGSAFVTLPEPLRERFWREVERSGADRPSLLMKAVAGASLDQARTGGEGASPEGLRQAAPCDAARRDRVSPFSKGTVQSGMTGCREGGETHSTPSRLRITWAGVGPG
jgi:DNA ligase D-like protein (predicted ligase)